MITNQAHMVVRDKGTYYIIPKEHLAKWNKRKSIPAWAEKVGSDLKKLEFDSYTIRDDS